MNKREHVLDLVQSRILEDIEQQGSQPPAEISSGYSRDYVKQIILYALDRTEISDGSERQSLIEFVSDHVLGLGPLEPLLKDCLITDILVEGLRVFACREGVRTEEDGFSNQGQVRMVIDRITAKAGKRVDLANPVCDCDLYEGSRCHIIIPPVADKVYLTIRKHGCMDLTLTDWTAKGAMREDEAAFLEKSVRERKNILISGGTGAGKTTLLNTCAKHIDMNHMIVTIEDTYELALPHCSVRRLLTRDDSVEGIGKVTFRDLIKNALRMNPDRLIMGEVRDESAYDLLHALNIGHRGSLSTIHANSIKDSLWRLETLALSGSPGLSVLSVKRQLTRVIDVVVQLRGLEADEHQRHERRIVEMAVLDNDLSGDEVYVVRQILEGGM